MADSDLASGTDLPPGDTVRWSPHRKASVVYGVRNGAISLDEACRRYQLSAEEFLAWQQAVATHGLGALRVTRLQHYRNASVRRRCSATPRRRVKLSGAAAIIRSPGPAGPVRR